MQRNVFIISAVQFIEEKSSCEDYRLIELLFSEVGLKIAQVGTQIAFPSEDLDGLNELNEEIAIALRLPIFRIALHPDLSLLALIMRISAFTNEKEVIQLIEQGSVFINHQPIRSPHLLLRYDIHSTRHNFSLLRIGEFGAHPCIFD